jgi:hypothetical protein
LRPRHFSLGDFARLSGILIDHSRICRWARCYVYNIINQLGTILNLRHRILVKDQTDRIASRFDPVPRGMQKRLDQLISRAKAQLLWKNRSRYRITSAVVADLRFLSAYLTNPANPWSMSIGHFVKRAPIGCSYGDASTGRGMGFYSHTHKFYSVMFWSPELLRRIHLKNKALAIHINQLEMVAYLLQLVVIATAIKDPSQMTDDVAELLRRCPTAPQWLVYVDNMATKFWGERAMASSVKGQLLLRLQAAIYYTNEVNGQTQYIKSTDNTLADLLSRSPLPPLTPDSYSSFLQQVHTFDSRLKTYHFFHPSPNFISLLRSILLSNASLDITCLPNKLGRFAPTAPDTFSGVML